MNARWFLLWWLLLTAPLAFAQESDTTAAEEEDYSMYADAELAGDAKRFCTSKVFDQSPNKLISIGYDYQGPYDMAFASVGNAPAQKIQNEFNRGLRIGANVPVISNTKLVLTLGANYWENFYNIREDESLLTNPLALSLSRYGLRTMGLNFTVFKPLNEEKFILAQGQGDLNGNYSLESIQNLSYIRYSGTLVYGFKKHDRLMYGFGVSRTYRVGEPNYIPVFLYNYTFPNRKWGVEAIFPARAHLRRNWNARTMGFFGYELEGQTYRIANRGNEFESQFNDVELRRSELRIRFMIERSIKDFVWFSLQAGYRYDWNFYADRGDFFRGFTGGQDYLMENSIANSLYVNFSINLVSP